MNHNIAEKGDALHGQSFLTIHKNLDSPKSSNHRLFLLTPPRKVNNAVEF